MADVSFESLSLGHSVPWKSYQLVDVRESSLFHGWSSDKLQRTGGHLRGSQLFSHSWICGTDDINQHRAKQRAELAGLNSQPLVLIGTGVECKTCRQDIAVSTGKWLVRTFNMPATDISITTPDSADRKQDGDVDCPLVVGGLPAGDVFVTAEWLNACIMNGESVCVLHAGWDDRDVFLFGHIPSAHYVDLKNWEDPETNNFCPVEYVAVLTDSANRFKLNGARIVLYDTGVGIAASRLGVMLWSLGLTNLCILSGGLRSWCKSGFPAARVPQGSLEVARHPLGCQPRVTDDVFVGLDFVREITLGLHANTVLVSCCSWKEYVGSVSGYDYISRRGRIPTARWALSGGGKDDLWHWHDELGAAADWNHLARLWEVAGITRSTHVVLYCGTGWRCSAIWFYLRALGYECVSVFDGGWYEWSSDPSNKVATGIPASPWFSALSDCLPPCLLNLSHC